MSFMKKNLITSLRIAMGIISVATLAVSCSKNNDTPASSSTSSVSRAVTIPGTSPYTITGKYGNPALGPSGFGTVYVNLATPAQDSTGTFTGVNVLFTSFDNSFVKVPSGYTLKYLYNTGATFTSLKISDFTTTASASGVGQNTGGATPNGWYNYDTEGNPTPIAGFYLLVTPTSGGTSYAFYFSSVSAQGTATWNRGVYTIRYGVIDNN